MLGLKGEHHLPQHAKSSGLAVWGPLIPMGIYQSDDCSDHACHCF